MPRRYTGKYAGYTVSELARLAGASRWTTRKELGAFLGSEEFAGRTVTPDTVGEFLCRLRNKLRFANDVEPLIGDYL